MKQKKRFYLLLALCLFALLASGCGVPREGVDITTTAPEGFWQILIVWPLAKFLLAINQFLQDANIPHHWGFAIIAFTLLVKAATFPLTISQMRGMQAQKELQPKIQELQKKYGKDRQRMIEEQTKLYQEAGINPVSGCLPLVIQMPILFGLYSAMVALGPAMDNSSFFWIGDLGYPAYDAGMSWITELFNAGEYGRLIGYLILPILLVISQFVMQKWMTPAPTGNDSQTAMMRQMMLMMTFMFGFFTLTVPSGLTLYWVVNNLLQMLQQWLTTNGPFNLTGAKPALALPGSAQTAAVVSTNSSETSSATVNSSVATVSDAAEKAAKRRKAKRK